MATEDLMTAEERAKSELNKRVLNEFLEENPNWHKENIQAYSTPLLALQTYMKNGKDAAEALVLLVEERLHACPRVVIYMPDPYLEVHKQFTGKVIVETYNIRGGSAMYLEIQISTVSDFSKIEEVIIRDDPWEGINVYKNIRLERGLVVKFAQALLFSGIFMQRSLITTRSDVMGSISTQKLRAGSGHDVFVHRRCLLKE